MNTKLIILGLALGLLVSVGYAAYSYTRLQAVQSELADAKTKVVEKLVIAHNPVQCVNN